MIRTNVFCTEEEAKEIQKAHKEARTTPVIALSVAHGLSTGGFAGEAWTDLRKLIHGCALKHGLPEIKGYYGIDLSNKEFVRD